MTLQDIKETKTLRMDAQTGAGMHGQRENSIPHHKVFGQGCKIAE